MSNAAVQRPLAVAVLGAGGVGQSYAAWMAARGHAVRLWSPSGRSTAAYRQNGVLRATGLLDGEWPVAAPLALRDAVGGADVIVVAIPVNAHRRLWDDLLPLLEARQALIVSAPIGFSSLNLKRRLETAGASNLVASWYVTALNGRTPEPGEVYVSGKRPWLDVAAWPEARAGEAVSLCETLFGIETRFIGGLALAEMSNINAVAHAGNALCNLTRMEKGESWFTYGGITPRVASLIEAADAERLRIGAGLGMRLESFAGYLRAWYGLDDAGVAALAARIAERPNPTPAPRTDRSRYVTEDIPFGIVSLVRLGDRLGIRTPVLEALATVFDTLYAGEWSEDMLFLDDIDRLAAAH